jgi:hypothetical protein
VRLTAAVLSCLVSIAVVSAAEELMVGPVAVRVGVPDGPVVAELRAHFAVRAIDGGWEVRSRDMDDQMMPLVSIGTQDGRTKSVSLVWGPGPTPSWETIAEQLAHALPADASCRVESVTRPFEGGTVRTLRFRCKKTIVHVQSGLWPQANTASIGIQLE